MSQINQAEMQEILESEAVIQQEKGLRAALKDEGKRKKALFKLFLFTIEIIVITIITARIPNFFAAMFVALILGFFLTKLVDYLVKKYEAKYFPEEVHKETRVEVAESVIKSWDYLPDFLKDEVMTVVMSARKLKLYKETKKKNAFKTLVLALLETRQAFRDKNYEKVEKLAKKIIRKSDKKGHETIIEEAEMLLKAIPK